MKCVNLLLVLGLAVPAWAQDARAQTERNSEAQNVYRLAQRTEAAGDSLSAFFLYGRAAKLDPSNAIYAMQQQAVQGRLQQGALATSVSDPLIDPSITPEDDMARRIVVEQLTPSEVIESDPARAPQRLKPSTERKSLAISVFASPCL